MTRARGTNSRVIQRAPDGDQSSGRLMHFARYASGAMDNQNHIAVLLTRLPYPQEEFPLEQATDEELQAFTEWTGIELPDDVLAWLKIANGLFIGGQALLGIRTIRGRNLFDIDRVLKLHPSWKDKGWLPIGDDGFGDYYVIPLKGDYGPGFPVVFFDHEVDMDSAQYIVASDLEHFIRFTIEEATGAYRLAFRQGGDVRKGSRNSEFQGCGVALGNVKVDDWGRWLGYQHAF